MNDGSLIQPTKTARKSIETILRRQNCTQGQIKEALSKFDVTPSNDISEIHPGLEMAKWDIEKIELSYNGSSLMNPLVPLKIAYEFIACHLGAGDVKSKRNYLNQ